MGARPTVVAVRKIRVSTRKLKSNPFIRVYDPNHEEKEIGAALNFCGNSIFADFPYSRVGATTSHRRESISLML
jgi:hypothetical protein